MTQVRAFVGHSFEEADADVVRKFLRFFEQLSKSAVPFSWDHAEIAEPKLLAEKVLSKIADKNVFIGICTKKEYVAPVDALVPTLIPRGQLRGYATEFEWKTSDWVIQEIGLAKGRELELILLVENGLRRPGGLQGDVEYISFDREAPEKSFGKIVEMLTALAPKASGAGVAASGGKEAATPDENSAAETGSAGHWSDPQPDWDRERYELALHFKALLENENAVERINKAYLVSADAEQGDNRATWSAYVEYTRLAFGKGGSLSRLETLAEQHPESSGTLEQLALGYRHYQDYEKASRTLERAARLGVKTEEVIRLLGQASVDYHRSGDTTKTGALREEMQLIFSKEAVGEGLMLNAFRKMAELAKEHDLEIAIMERIVEREPDDIYTRFALAYKYSGRGNNDLALFHYLRIPPQERTGVTWNNVGVAYDRFSMPTKSVLAYRQAKALGETLAMSNLGAKLIGAGFLEEAQAECAEALKTSNHHENVGHTLARIKEAPEKEGKEEADLIKKAQPKSEFYRRLGRAFTGTNIDGLSGTWRGPSCTLEVMQVGMNFRATGSYESPQNAMMGLGGLFAARKTADTVMLKYEGVVKGGTIDGLVTRERLGGDPPARTLLSALVSSPTVLMFLSDDGKKLHVMENPQAVDPQFYELVRLSG